MNPLIIFVMVAQIVVFLGWAFVAFRTWIRLNAITSERRRAEGMSSVGVSGMLPTFFDFLRGRVLPADRLQLILLTLVLIATSALPSLIE